jgi:hypothetical protein
MFGRSSGEGVPIDQTTTGGLWLAITFSSALAMVILAAALFFLYMLLTSLLFLWERGVQRVVHLLAVLGFLLVFAVWANGAVVLWTLVWKFGTELRRRKKSDQSRI